MRKTSKMLKMPRMLCRLSALMALVMLFCAIPLQSAAWYQPNTRVFDNMKDVPENGWAHDGIKWVVSNGIMLSTGSNSRYFDPNAKVTRSMYTKICYNLIQGLERDTTLSGKPLPFKDTVANAWYLDSLTWAYENKVINGYSEIAVGPNDQVTREQIARLMYNLLTQYFGADLSEKAVDLKIFKDHDKISGWATDAVSAMVAIGLYKGDSAGNFNPQGLATRAEIAVLTERLYRYYTETPACYLDADIYDQLVPTMLEEFDGEGRQGWNHNFWTNPTNNYAGDWQLPQEERVYTEDGNLYMDILYPGDNDTRSQNCIGSLISGCDVPNTFAQAYGFFEIRFKPCPARGICSAWWLTTNAEGYPEVGSDHWNVEMDIFETTVKDKQLHTTVHDHGQDPSDMIDINQRQYVMGNRMKIQRSEGNPFCIPDESMFDGKFHTAGFLWTKEGYTVYYDGNFAGTFTYDDSFHISDLPAVIWLNAYYWNNEDFAGPCYREDFDENGISQYVVDYVRIYQLSSYLDDYAPRYYGNPLPEYYAAAIDD